MIASPHPLEHELGMDWYADHHPGIDGRLRDSPGDFVVEEISGFEERKGGKHLVCRLSKQNWELQRAVVEISRILGISHRRIGWAGTKDKRAHTTQLISIYNVRPDDLERIRLPGITVTPLGYTSEELRLGDLRGNRFSITIRGCRPDRLGDRVEEIAGTVRTGIPNYFGLQRFGVIRPITHRVGRAILRGEYGNAVRLYIGESFPGEQDSVKAARDAFLQDGDPRQLLTRLPDGLRYERAMANRLITAPGDYAGAIRAVPPRLLSMFVSAYQSYLFNRAVSARMEREPDFHEPSTGDRLLFHDGREDVVTARTLPAARQQIRRGRCAVAILMPGSTPVTPAGADDSLMHDLMEEDGIDHCSFEEAARFTRTAFRGALRLAAIAPEVGARVEEVDTVRLDFALPAGSYATTVCREFMKAAPEQMI